MRPSIITASCLPIKKPSNHPSSETCINTSLQSCWTTNQLCHQPINSCVRPWIIRTMVPSKSRQTIHHRNRLSTTHQNSRTIDYRMTSVRASIIAAIYLAINRSVRRQTIHHQNHIYEPIKTAVGTSIVAAIFQSIHSCFLVVVLDWTTIDLTRYHMDSSHSLVIVCRDESKTFVLLSCTFVIWFFMNNAVCSWMHIQYACTPYHDRQ